MAFVGPSFPEKITALIAFDDLTFVSAGKTIYVVDRNVIVSKIELKKETVSSLAVFGDVLVASGHSSIYIFDINNYGNF